MVTRLQEDIYVWIKLPWNNKELGKGYPIGTTSFSLSPVHRDGKREDSNRSAYGCYDAIAWPSNRSLLNTQENWKRLKIGWQTNLLNTWKSVTTKCCKTSTMISCSWFNQKINLWNTS